MNKLAVVFWSSVFGIAMVLILLGIGFVGSLLFTRTSDGELTVPVKVVDHEGVQVWKFRGHGYTKFYVIDKRRVELLP